MDLADDPETNGSSSGYHSTHDSDEGVVSSLELENRLLKNEIASLNQEMSTVIQRSRTAQEGNVRVNKMAGFVEMRYCTNSVTFKLKIITDVCYYSSLTLSEMLIVYIPYFLLNYYYTHIVIRYFI